MTLRAKFFLKVACMYCGKPVPERPLEARKALCIKGWRVSSHPYQTRTSKKWKSRKALTRKAFQGFGYLCKFAASRTKTRTRTHTRTRVEAGAWQIHPPPGFCPA